MNIQGTQTGRFQGTTPDIRDVPRFCSSRVIQVLVGGTPLPVRQNWVPGRGWVTAGLPV